MNEFEKSMEEVFDIDVVGDGGQVTEQVQSKSPSKSTDEDQGKDYEYTRGQLYNLIEKGQEAAQGALEVAQESGHPRAYEVAINAMKQVADMSDKLIDLQKKMKDLDAPTKTSSPTTVNNTMFVGSTADLQKMLKETAKAMENMDDNK
jgi:hypothetical protein